MYGTCTFLHDTRGLKAASVKTMSIKKISSYCHKDTSLARHNNSAFALGALQTTHNRSPVNKLHHCHIYTDFSSLVTVSQSQELIHTLEGI